MVFVFIDVICCYVDDHENITQYIILHVTTCYSITLSLSIRLISKTFIEDDNKISDMFSTKFVGLSVFNILEGFNGLPNYL